MGGERESVILRALEQILNEQGFVYTILLEHARILKIYYAGLPAPYDANGYHIGETEFVIYETDDANVRLRSPKIAWLTPVLNMADPQSIDIIIAAVRNHAK